MFFPHTGAENNVCKPLKIVQPQKNKDSKICLKTSHALHTL